jgi:hypothetical protein
MRRGDPGEAIQLHRTTGQQPRQTGPNEPPIDVDFRDVIHEMPSSGRTIVTPRPDVEVLPGNKELPEGTPPPTMKRLPSGERKALPPARSIQLGPSSEPEPKPEPPKATGPQNPPTMKRGKNVPRGTIATGNEANSPKPQPAADSRPPYERGLTNKERSELNDVRGKMAALDKRIGAMRSWTARAPLIEKYRAMEERRLQLEGPRPRTPEEEEFDKAANVNAVKPIKEPPNRPASATTTPEPVKRQAEKPVSDASLKIVKPEPPPIRYKDLSPEMKAEVDKHIGVYSGTDYWNQEFTRQSTGIQQWKDLPIRDRFANAYVRTQEALKPEIEKARPELEEMANHPDPEISSFAKSILDGTSTSSYLAIQDFTRLLERYGDASAKNQFFEAVDALANESGDWEPGADAEEQGAQEASEPTNQPAKADGGKGEEQEPLAPSTQVLSRYPNREDGTEAVVAKIPKGYSVVLRDTDANRAVPEARIFKTEAEAQEYAKKIANVKGPQTLPGMENAVAENKAAAGKEQARQMTEKINEPPKATRMTLSEALEAQKQRKIKMVQSMIENKIPDGYAALINDLLAAANIGKARQMDGRYFQINEDGSLTERVD